ncbi:MAG: TRAP transporter permease [Bacillota bacterium]
MTNTAVGAEKEKELQGLLEEKDSEQRIRSYIGLAGKFVTIFAVIWSLFQLYATSFGVFDAIRLRTWHILFLLTMAFLLYPASKGEKKVRSSPAFLDIACILLSIGAFAYLLLNYKTIALRGGYLLPVDYVAASIGVIMVFEAARRTVGNLAYLAGIFFLYNFAGAFIPGAFGHSGFAWKRVVEHMFWGSQGLLGIGIGVSATYIFLFMLFGAFLRISGFSSFINDLALTVAGRTAGGPAKVAVLASALMGMINGSAVANVATTGTITIPLMKKNGYNANFAAAVEAVASTGGQFCPPIMGAVGFIMAEFLGVPYTKVMLAAIIPAFLYYLTLIMAVHFEAKKTGLRGLSKENIPKALEVIKKRGHLIIPLITLLVILFLGYTPLYAAVFSILATIAASWLSRETRMSLGSIIQALEEGAKSAVGVGVACIIIGVIIGTVSLTGLGLTFGYQILRFVGDGQLFLGGFLVMLMSIILGMGVPGIAAYVIVAAVAAPVLIHVGATPMAAHMFVLIYACLSNITPPVAMSSYVAAGIAHSDQNKTSCIAVKLGLIGFLLPFFFLYHPALLFEGASKWQSLHASLTATLGVISLASALQGWLLTKHNWITRVLLFLTAFLTLEPSTVFDLLGFGLFMGVVLWQKLSLAKTRVEGTEAKPI